MKKAAYRAGRIQVQGTLKIDVFSHVEYRETLARKRFWAVLWRLAHFLRLLAQPLCWNDKTRSFRNASSTSEIHFFYAKSAIKRQDAARKLIFAPVLAICVFAQCGWNPNYFFANVLKSGVHQTPTHHFNLRFWGTVSWRERSRDETTPPPDFKNPSNGSKRPYTHTHAANSYWRSLT